MLQPNYTIQKCQWMAVFCVTFAVKLSQNCGGWDFTRKFTLVWKINTACIAGRNSQIKPILTSTKPRNIQMENIRSNLESKLLRWWLELGLKKLPKNWCFMNQPWDLGWPMEEKTTAVNVTNRSDSNHTWRTTWNCTKAKRASLWELSRKRSQTQFVLNCCCNISGQIQFVLKCCCNISGQTGNSVKQTGFLQVLLSFSSHFLLLDSLNVHDTDILKGVWKACNIAL